MTLEMVATPTIVGRSTVVYAETPPPGIVPDYAHPAWDATAAIVTIPVFLGLAFVLVLCRVYSRCVLMRAMGADDYMTIAAMIFTTGMGFLCMMTARFGLGHHLWVVPLEKYSSFLKWEYCAQLVYACASCTSKLAIVFLLLRISPERTFRFCAFGLAAFILAYHLSMFWGIAFSCLPVAKTWDPSIEGGHCINVFTLVVAGNVFNVVADVGMWVLPIPVVWRLNIRRQQKWELTLVFLVGIIIVVVSVIRIPNQLALVNVTDLTWEYVKAHVWSNLEVNICIICGCLPTIRPLLRIALPGLFAASETGSSAKKLSDGNREGFLSLNPVGQRSSRSNPETRVWDDVEDNMGNETQVTASRAVDEDETPIVRSGPPFESQAFEPGGSDSSRIFRKQDVAIEYSDSHLHPRPD
ncbi:MAG: hypothetical protein M4579_000987 [Chaenotheca gracillima]|nr:MAG: hypothetical protein M4579_000987 [Chaenotheca gracillima]